MIKTIALAVLAGGTLAAAADKEWKATLTPKNGSTVEGSAKVEAKGADSTKMEIKIKGGAAKTDYAWHMHSGSCAADGPVVGDKAAYPQLMTDSSGTASVEARLAVRPPASGEYSIHVHGMVADTMKPAPTVACGDLKEDD